MASCGIMHIGKFLYKKKSVKSGIREITMCPGIPLVLGVYTIVSFNLKVLAKFGLCWNYSQKIRGVLACSDSGVWWLEVSSCGVVRIEFRSP